MGNVLSPPHDIQSHKSDWEDVERTEARNHYSKLLKLRAFVMTLPPSKPNHLEPSQLGTKEYWDNLYITELSNHALDPTDEGTIWFDDSAAEDKSFPSCRRRSQKSRS